jgi:hypothetical protein
MYGGDTANNLYIYMPSLLELPDIQCGEFKEKLSILLKGLLEDIKNINNPDQNTPMLYEKNIHLKNAMDFVRAVFACIYCLMKKIKDENNTEDCHKIPLENTTQEVVNSKHSLNVLLETFNLSNPNIHDKPSVIVSNVIDEDKYNIGSTSNTMRSSSGISSLTSNTSRISSMTTI